MVGQRVLARNYREGPKWIPGTVVDQNGSLSFVVQVTDGTKWRRHSDQLLVALNSPQDISLYVSSPPPPELPLPSSPVMTKSDAATPVTTATQSPTKDPPSAEVPVPSTPTRTDSPTQSETTTSPPPRRYL